MKILADFQIYIGVPLKYSFLILALFIWSIKSDIITLHKRW